MLSKQRVLHRISIHFQRTININSFNIISAYFQHICFYLTIRSSLVGSEIPEYFVWCRIGSYSVFIVHYFPIPKSNLFFFRFFPISISVCIFLLIATSVFTSTRIVSRTFFVIRWLIFRCTSFIILVS